MTGSDTIIQGILLAFAIVVNNHVQLSGAAKAAIDDIAPDTVDGWSAYPLGVIWAAGQHAADLAAARVSSARRSRSCSSSPGSRR